MPVVVYLLLLLLFSFLLIKSTEFLVEALNRLARSSKLGKFALTSSIIALATSLPELFVCLAAALEGKQALALGNVIGSNIANLSLVIGGATLISGTLPVFGGFFRKDLIAIFMAALLPLFLLLDGSLSRVDGLLLILVFGVYNYTILARHKKQKAKTQTRDFGILRRLNHKGTRRQIAWVFLGAAVLLFSADMIVKIAVQIASGLNLPLIFIGLFLVSAGTSLPELFFEIGAIKKKQIAMVFGNLTGSIIANATLILGLTALISPIKIIEIGTFFLATVFFIVIFLVFVSFVRSKRKLERWEAGVLILIYALFIFLEFFSNKIF